jgi:DNA-binding transcriptional LysR family regulator
MLDLRRLRLLRELRDRGTIAAVADALRYTPSAVSQQLAVLERETGVALLERAGRGVRLTDAALVLAGHADGLLERAAAAEADLAAASGEVVGRARVAGFHSVLVHIGVPAIAVLRERAPGLRCEAVEAEPEHALPALARGDVDLVLADEWPSHPLALPPGAVARDVVEDPVRVVLPAGHRLVRDDGRAVPLAALADEPWVSGHTGMAWERMTQDTCRSAAGFTPDIRHRAADASVALALVARGLAVTLLPDLALAGHAEPVAVRAIRGDEAHRGIVAVTRSTDANRPSTRALLAEVRHAGERLDHGSGSGRDGLPTRRG